MRPVLGFSGGVSAAFIKGFLSECGLVKLVGSKKIFSPFVGIVGGFYCGQRQSESVDGFACFCAWPGGGLASGMALDVNGAALNAAGGPAFFDC